MPELTDHRAEAARYLQALDAVIRETANKGRKVEGAILAQAAIGHALLAGQPPEHTTTVNVPNYTGSRDGMREALTDMARRGQLPPVSPSEG